MKNYIKKAHERLAKEKMAVQGQADAATTEGSKRALVTIAKSTGRTKFEGMVLTKGPISATPLTVVPGNISEVTKENEDSVAGTSNPEKRPPIDVDSPPKKKMKSAEGGISWAEFLQDFSGEGEIKSLWDKHFPAKNFVREQIATVDDGDRIRSLGLEQACLALQSFALKSATISHVVNDEFNKLRLRERQGKKDVEAAKKAIAAHVELLQDYNDLKAKLAEQQRLFEEKEEFVKKQLEETESQWKAKIEEIRTILKTQEEKLTL